MTTNIFSASKVQRKSPLDDGRKHGCFNLNLVPPLSRPRNKDVLTVLMTKKYNTQTTMKDIELRSPFKVPRQTSPRSIMGKVPSPLKKKSYLERLSTTNPH